MQHSYTKAEVYPIRIKSQRDLYFPQKEKMLEVARIHKDDITSKISHAEDARNFKEVKRLNNYKTAILDLMDRLDENDEEASYFRSVLREGEVSYVSIHLIVYTY